VSQGRPAVSYIIPAHNEADRVGETIGSLKGVAPESEIIVVDDGSLDATADAGAQAGADSVVRCEVRQGKGAALAAGLARARASVIAFVDADLGASAAQMAEVVEPVLGGQADMAIAAFGPSERGGFGIVVETARRGIKKLCGVQMRSPLSGQRAIAREVLDRIGGLEPGYGVDVALTVDALRAGARVIEVPVTMTHRELGKSLGGFMHRGRQFLQVRAALKKRATRRR
jgi:glycosyltransferase involved in cell wall biosynthesis